MFGLWNIDLQVRLFTATDRDGLQRTANLTATLTLTLNPNPQQSVVVRCSPLRSCVIRCGLLRLIVIPLICIANSSPSSKFDFCTDRRIVLVLQQRTKRHSFVRKHRCPSRSCWSVMVEPGFLSTEPSRA